MKIGKTNAIFGGVVYNFVPFVAPESFKDPRKYADYGLKVNLQAKFKAYKQTWSGADIAVEFSDAIASVSFTSAQITSGSIIEIFETISGVETSVLRTTTGTHTFTSGSTKRYMIRRVTNTTSFTLPVGSVWAYCCCIVTLIGYPSAANPYLKYVFFYENTLTQIGFFRDTNIQGTLYIPSGVTSIQAYNFFNTPITKVITSNNLTTINGGNVNGAFLQCTSLQVADLGTGVTSIGIDTFNGCTSLQVIYLRSHIPPTIVANTFRGVPATTIWKVPAEDLATYKGWTNYTSFASRIFAI